MIKLNRLGGEPFLLNAERIRYVEARPDTFVTMDTGDRVIVQQSLDEVMRLVIEYQRAKHLIPPPYTGSVAAGAEVAPRRRGTSVQADLVRSSVETGDA